jgi:amino acid adenylation domain-containing protein
MVSGSLIDLLETAAERWGDRPLLLGDAGALSYGDFLAGVNGLAAHLAASGVAASGRVAVILPNGPEILYAWFALGRLGAVMVPIDPALHPAEVEPLLRAVGVDGMIADAESLRRYAPPLDLPVRVLAGEGEVPGAVSFATPPLARAPGRRAGAHDLSTLLRTSGTTGPPKGAALTHASYVLSAREFVSWMEVEPGDRCLACLPLFHLAGQAFAAGVIAGGASLALVRRFSAGEFWGQVRRHRITLARHLGEMLAALCRLPETAEDRRHTLRAVYGGGARAEVAERFERRFGVAVVEGYGLTETNTVLRNELGARRHGSIGRPLPYAEVRIADGEGRALPCSTDGARHVGEIQVRRNPVMMTGYFAEPELTASCFAGDWFRTGDLGYRDADGYFYFVSRQKEIIRRRGENIAPLAIEMVLDRHPAVLHSAVVGVPDSLGGEEVKAYVVCRPGPLAGVEELTQWCRGGLAEFEVPRYFDFCLGLPRTATNKINKSELRARPPAAIAAFDRHAPDTKLVRASGEGASPSLVELLRRRAEERPAHGGYVFLRDGEGEAGRLGYGELDAWAREIAAGLQEDFRPGARVLLVFPPGLEFIAAFFGCLYAGLIAVPVYPPRFHKGLGQLRHVVRDARPAAVLSTAELAAAAARADEPDLAGLAWVAVDRREPGRAERWRQPAPDGDTAAFLQYTSGSTGDPKGVLVSHRNLAHNLQAIRRVFGLGAGSVVVGWLPVYHDMGLIGNVLQPLYCGGTCVLMSPASFLQRPMRWLQAISRYRATASGGPNFAYELCVRKAAEAECRGLDLGCWEVAFNGAEPVRQETLARFAEAFAPWGFRRSAFRPCYGLAEATLLVAGVAAGAPPPRGSAFAADALAERRVVAAAADPAGGEAARVRVLVGCGPPLPDQRLLVVDPETLDPCPPDRVGEIWLAGPSVAQGYWERPRLSAEIFGATLPSAGTGERFLRTGDLGFLHQGDLFLAGRLKDLIIVRGRNLYPQDVERSVEGCHPSLRPGGGAAFAVDSGGEERLVVVHEVDRHARAPAAEVASAVRRVVAEEHEVQVYEVVLLRAGSLAKTSSGKVRRRACAAAWQQGTLAAVGRSRLAEAAGPLPVDGGGPGVAEPPGLALPALALDPRAAAAARQEGLLAWLRAAAAAACGLPPEALDPQRPLAEQGLDSLAAIALTHTVETSLELALPVGDLLGGAGLASLAATLAERLRHEDRHDGEGTPSGGGASAVPGRPPAEPAVDPRADGQLARGSAAAGPLSYGQRALYFFESLAPASAVYNLAVAARVHGELDLPALRQAFAVLVDRHEALRTSFSAASDADGEPMRQVHARRELDFATVDATSWSAARALGFLRQEAYRPFDLAGDPLLRVRLLSGAGDGSRLLLVVVHHLVADFHSLASLTRELRTLYGAAAPLPPLQTLRFGDYVLRQEQLLAGPEGARLRDYWHERLAGDLRPLDLPCDRPRPQLPDFRGGSVAGRWDAGRTAALAGLARAAGATPFVALLSAFQTLLHRYTAQDDLLVGSPASGRLRPELAGLVGYLVNPVALRASFAADPPFADLLAANRQEVLGALAHQDYPFALLAERLQPARDPGSTPLLQVMLVLQGAVGVEDRAVAELALGEAGARLPLAGLALESLALGECRLPFDLTLMAAAAGGGLALALQYRHDLFDAVTVQRLLGHLENLLAAAAAEPARRVSELPLLAAAERFQLFCEWNAAAGAGAAADRCLHELVEEQAARTPTALALSTREESLAYAELVRRAGGLARHLRRLGVGPEVPVGLLLDRCAALVVAQLAVLQAGGAYVPLDPAYPVERLRFMAADAGLRLVLSRGELPRRLGEAPLGDLAVVRLEELADGAAAPAASGGAAATPRNLAYLLYTSGSTGRPKAVGIEHRSAVALLRWAEERFTRDEVAAVLAATSLCFDLSVFEIFAPLCRGGAAVLVEDGLHLPSWPGAPGPTLLNTVPSVLSELLAGGGLPASVRTVNLAGEPLKGSLVRQLYDTAAVRSVRNLYGPTEDTTYSLCQPIAAGEESPAIGRPLPGTRAYLLDRRLRPLPLGAAGELWLAGSGLARGYLGRPELTADRFRPDPFAPLPGERMYRTGDLARRRHDGSLDFRGRLDFQIKLHGFRIEPGEIEAALERHRGVATAAVVLREDRPGDPRLVAYLVPRPGEALDTDGLRRWLAERLPAHALPAALVVLPALPRTRSGKLDRRALPAPADPAPAGSEPAAARRPVAEVLAEIWCEVLGVERVGADDDFFALGGHSLVGHRVLARVRRALGADLPLSALFTRPTLTSLAAAIEEALGGPAAETAPPVRLQAGERPLSFAQERIWFVDRIHPGTALYNMPAAVRLLGDLDLPPLAASCAEIARRHEVLRATFPSRGGVPEVRVAPRPPHLPLADLSGLPAAARAGEAHRLAAAEARRPFVLELGPLLRLTLLRLAAREHLALVNMHHMVSDGGSMEIFYRELAALYGAFAAGRPSPLPDLELQYADFAAWQRERQRGESLERELAHWRGELAGSGEGLDLPADRPRPAVPDVRGAVRTLALPPPALTALRRLGRRHECTLFMTLLAACQVLLARYTGATDFLVGTPSATRDRVELEGLIGPFLNLLVLRADLAADPGFATVMTRVRAAALTADRHRELPFERLVQELRPGRDLARNPLFQVAFVFHRPSGERLAAAGLELLPRRLASGTAKFDWTLAVEESAQGCTVELEYSSALFDASTAERTLANWQGLLAAAAASPGLRVSELPLLAAAERQQLLCEWNDTAAALPGELCVHQLVAAQAARTPRRPALRCAGREWSYGELDEQAARWARVLAGAGVGPEVPVGLLFERSAEMVIALLAVLKAGGAYLPLDPTYPAERLAYMLADSGAPLLLAGVPLDPRLRFTGRVLSLAEPAAAPAPRRTQSLPAMAAPGNLAYLIYTSGSTGRPKGVEVSHAGVVNFLCAMARRLAIGPGDTLLAVTTLSFDIAVLELLLPLATGARVVLATREEAADGRRLAGLLADPEVSYFQATPATWRLLLEAGWPGSPGLAVLCGGEALAADLAGELQRRGRQLWNLYGPTETTVWSAALELRPGTRRVALGAPLANTQLYLLDGAGHPVPAGIPGELAIGGVGLARGYRGRPELTAERFVPDPFAGPPGGGRLYLTGDLARYHGDGTLEFLGRRDQQVKVRGYRIELQEIETVLRQHPAVRDAAVTLHGGAAAGPRLAGFFVAVPGERPEAGELRRWLQGHLPPYMVPAWLSELAELPRTPNGKVDRKALPAGGMPPAAGQAAPAECTDPSEELLAGLFSAALGVERVGPQDSFFDLGGHSLLAARLQSRVRQTFGVELPLRVLFASPTPAGLAAHLRSLPAGRPAAAPSLVARPGEGPFPLSFAQEGIWFMDRLDLDSPAFNIAGAVELAGDLATGALAASLEQVVRRHQVLRSRFAELAGRPHAWITAAGARTLPLADLQALAPPRRQAEAARLAREEGGKPFDLARGPLLRALLLRLGARSHLLLLTLHHIAADGDSLALLLREFRSFYGSLAGGEPAALPELAAQYHDYASWQRQWLTDDVLAPQLAYWRGRLAGLQELALPADRPRPARPSGRGAVARRRIDDRLAAALPDLARGAEATLFIVLATAFKALLHWYSGQEEIVLGCDVGSRNRLELEPLIGLFVNQLTLVTSLAGDPPFRTLIARVRDGLLAAHAHQELPFEKLVEALRPRRTAAAAPLFQAKLNLRRALGEQEVAGLTVRPRELARRRAQLDLVLNCELGARGDGLDAVLEYGTDLFAAATADRMLALFEIVLGRAAAEPEIRPSALAAALAAADQELLRAQHGETKSELSRRLRQVRRRSVPGFSAAGAAPAAASGEGEP